MQTILRPKKDFTYSAQFRYEEDAPPEALRQGKENLRYQILNDMDYHLEVIKEIEMIEQAIRLEIEGCNRYLNQKLNWFQILFGAKEIKQMELSQKCAIKHLNHVLENIVLWKERYTSRVRKFGLTI